MMLDLGESVEKQKDCCSMTALVLYQGTGYYPHACRSSTRRR